MKRSTISIIIIVVLSGICLPQNHWEKTNGPIGGFMRSVDKGPDNKVICGSRDGRIFYSEDNGEIWS
jgi:hypothetical protein